jgi:tetratricopeptide (TPR) repeat protein
MTRAAFISGRLQFALLHTGESWLVLTPDGTEELARMDEISLLRSDLAEFRQVSFEDKKLVLEQLNHDIITFDSLFLLLSIISPDIGFSSKLLAMQTLDDLLASGVNQDGLLNILLSTPLPSDARSSRASIRELASSFDTLSPLFHKLFASQEYIDQVHSSWKDASAALDDNTSRQLEVDFKVDGTFAVLVRASQASTLVEFNTIVLDRLIALRNRPDAGRVMETMRGLLQRSLFGHKVKQKILRMRREPVSSGKKPQRSSSIDELITADVDAKFSRLSAFEAKTSVDRQITAIKKELLSGRDDLIEKFASDLVQFQLEHSERTHLAKSLCLLATASLDSNRLDIADLLSNAAVSLGVDDAVVYTSRAEVLKGLGLFGSALQAFKDAALRFPFSNYAWMGIADVHKEMGHYKEARAAYLDAQAKFPDLSVPFNGLISVMRYEGDQKEALREAFRVAKRFPEDAFSRGSLATVLASNGHYEQAIKQYEIAKQLQGSNSQILRGHIRALNSLGRSSEALTLLRSALQLEPDGLTLNRLLTWQLRIMGRAPEALRLSRALLDRFPGYMPARLDMASAQLMLGEIGDALIEIGNRVLRSETEWGQYRMFIGSLISQEQYADANKLLESAMEECVWMLPRLQFETMLGWCRFKLGDVGGSIRMLQSNIDKIDDRLKQARLTLVGAVQLQAGDPVIGRTILTKVVKTKENAILSLQNEALQESGNVAAISILRLIVAA